MDDEIGIYEVEDLLTDIVNELPLEDVFNVTDIRSKYNHLIYQYPDLDLKHLIFDVSQFLSAKDLYNLSCMIK